MLVVGEIFRAAPRAGESVQSGLHLLTEGRQSPQSSMSAILASLIYITA